MGETLAIAAVIALGILTHLLARRMTGPLGQWGVPVVGLIVAGGFSSGIGLLYRLNEGYVPEALDRAFYPSLAAMLAGTVLLLRSLKLSDNSPALDFQGIDWFGTRQRQWRDELSRQTRERLRKLDADPRTRKYAALIRRGEHWSDDAIAYDLDPAHLASCAHLQRYERAMRQAGITINLSHPHHLSANCRIDIARLDHSIPRPPEVDYLEYPGDRPGDPQSAALYCRAHQCSIHVVHADEARPTTPWFAP